MMTDTTDAIDLTTAKVLLVEDTLSLARTYQGYLAGEPYSVSHVDTGALAMETLKSEEFDLILLDLRLPDTTGEKIMEWMQDSGIDVPVTVITAQGSVGVAVAAMRAGAVDFLMKPFSEERLIESVRHHLQERLFLKNRAPREAIEPGGDNEYGRLAGTAGWARLGGFHWPKPANARGLPQYRKRVEIQRNRLHYRRKRNRQGSLRKCGAYARNALWKARFSVT